MNSSIPELRKEISSLEAKHAQYVQAIKELKLAAQRLAEQISEGFGAAGHALKIVQSKIKNLRLRIREKEQRIEMLSFKIDQLKTDDHYFTFEDISGFEKALNENSTDELMIDKANPLFQNRPFLESIKTELERYELYEKCALLQKQIEKILI